jgi:hypothetical protein
MFTVVLRSVCVGIATLVGVTCLGLFVVLPVRLHFVSKHEARAGGAEVGWDLVTMAHNQPGTVKLIGMLALLVFAVGYYLGFRQFSKSLVRR